MPTSPVATSTPRVELSGTPLEELRKKGVDTPSHHISFEAADGTPELSFAKRVLTDPTHRSIATEDISTDSIESFWADYKRLVEANSDYLKPNKETFFAGLPADTATHSLYNQVVGRRRDAFFDGLRAAVSSSGASAELRQMMRKTINVMSREMDRGQWVQFDTADTSTYWSYTDSETGKYQGMVHLLEGMLVGMDEASPDKKEKIQYLIDYLYTHKCTPKGEMREPDAEVSIGRVAIDQPTRNRVDERGGSYFLEGTETPASNVVFRPLEVGEKLRSGFQFDWNQNGQVDMEKQITDWFGHCDIMAILQALLFDMKELKGIEEYDSVTKKRKLYTRDEALESPALMCSLGSVYQNARGQMISKAESKFAGSRFDKAPSTLYVRTSTGEGQYPIEITGLYEADGIPITNPSALFQPTVADGDMDFKKNERVLFHEGDNSFIDPENMILEGTCEGKPVRGTASEIFASLSGSSAKPTELMLGHQLKRNDQPLKKQAFLAESLHVGSKRSNDGDTGGEVWNGDMLGGAMETAAVNSDKPWLRTLEVVNVYTDATFSADKSGKYRNRIDEEGDIVATCEEEAAADFYWDEKPVVAAFTKEADGELFVNSSLVKMGLFSFSDSAAGQEKAMQACTALMQDLCDIALLGQLGSNLKTKPLVIVHEGKRTFYADKTVYEADIKKLEALPEEEEAGAEEATSDDGGRASDASSTASRPAEPATEERRPRRNFSQRLRQAASGGCCR